MLVSNQDIEKQLLAGLLQNQTFLDTRLSSLNVETFFYHEHKSVFKVIQEYYSFYRGLVTEIAFTNYLDKSNVDMDKRISYISLFRELKSLVVSNEDLRHAADALQEMRMQRALGEIITVASTQMETVGGFEALKQLESSLIKLKSQASLITISKKFAFEGIDTRRDLYVLRKEGKLPPGALFGFRDLDNLTEGLQRQELGVIIARLGSGKSRFLFNVGYNMAARQRLHVMYATLEMYTSQIERLYDSRSAGISYNRLKKGKLTPEEEQKFLAHIEEEKRNPTSFFIVDIPRHCTIEILESELDTYEKTYGHPVDVLVIDYLLLMEVIGNKEQNVAFKYANISRGLKELARQRNIPILTAGQTTRGSLQAAEVGTEHASYSDAIGWNCDLMLSLTQSKEEKARNIMNCSVIKYRDGANINIKLVVDFDKSFIGDYGLSAVQPSLAAPFQPQHPPLIA